MEQNLAKLFVIGDVSKQRELLSKFYAHLCEIAVIDSEYRTEYDKKKIPSKRILAMIFIHC